MYFGMVSCWITQSLLMVDKRSLNLLWTTMRKTSFRNAYSPMYWSTVCSWPSMCRFQKHLVVLVATQFTLVSTVSTLPCSWYTLFTYLFRTLQRSSTSQSCFAVQCRYRGELHAGTSDSDDRSLHRGSCACITCKLQSPAECWGSFGTHIFNTCPRPSRATCGCQHIAKTSRAISPGEAEVYMQNHLQFRV